MKGVYQHIKKGRFMLLIMPASIILCGIIITILYGNIKADITGLEFAIIIGTGFLISLGIGWLWWSFWVVKWKIWAYSDVQDIHLLYKRAVSGRLIWPQGHFYEKTELRLGKSGLKLTELEKRLDQPRNREWIKDESLPDEIQIVSNRNGLYAGTIGILLAVIWGAWFQTLIIPVCIAVFSALGFVNYFTHRKKGKIFMRINAQMVEINGMEIPWDKIEDFGVIHEGYGKYQETFLVIETSDPECWFQKINIRRGNVSRWKLEYLLDVYNSRFEKMKMF
ncbi:MAG: hypothetical protein R3C61_02205 [Bacteroidia bacterium]